MNSALKKNKLKPENWMTGAGVILAFIVIGALILNYFKVISLQEIFYGVSLNTGSTKGGFNLSRNAGKVIAKAGDEEIYQLDYNTEKSAYPKIGRDDTEKIIMQKLIRDSILLQAAAAEGWIKLDKRVFNSFQKDYPKRLQLVKDAENIYANRQNIISGSVISIWFNNMVPAEIGYEKGKEIALQKITALHNDIKSKKISVQQAVQAIIDDQSLARIDKSYQENALLSFRVSDDEKITFDSNFDSIIRGLSAGELSDVYLAKDKSSSSGEMIDAVYMFALVDEINAGMRTGSFDKWYSSKAKNYEVFYF